MDMRNHRNSELYRLAFVVKSGKHRDISAGNLPGCRKRDELLLLTPNEVLAGHAQIGVARQRA
jgi:hypothetical protein